MIDPANTIWTVLPLGFRHHNSMEPEDRALYIKAISKIIAQGFELGLSSGLIADLIVAEVVSLAIEKERSDWVQMAYAEFGEFLQ